MHKSTVKCKNSTGEGTERRMITEEQIKKAATNLLGEENKDWFYSTPKGHPNTRRVGTKCDKCKITRHVTFDLRETTCDIAARIKTEIVNGLYESGVF